MSSANKTKRQGGLIALESSSASITTASVTIRTLRVDSRQLTMGTFRQLTNRPMVDLEKIELLGTVWGWVNYDNTPDERQFIVQFGEQLCRCSQRLDHFAGMKPYQWPKPAQEMFTHYREAFTCQVFARAIEGTLKIPERPIDPLRYSPPVHDSPFPWFTIESGHEGDIDHEEKQLIRMAVKPEPVTGYHYPRGEGRSEIVIKKSADDVRSEAVASLRKKMETGEISMIYAFPDTSVEGLAREMETARREFIDYRDRWNGLMDRLRSVEQLFIAT